MCLTRFRFIHWGVICTVDTPTVCCPGASKEFGTSDSVFEDASALTLLAEFVCLLYVPYFLQTPLPAAAPRLDRDFYVDLEQYRVLYYIYK